MKPLTVVKLGGSAITDKAKNCTPNVPVIQAAIEQIAQHNGPIILLHGGGSYAHPLVSGARLGEGYVEGAQKLALAEAELNLDQLSRIIGVSLLLEGRPFVPLHPISFITTRTGRIKRSFLDPITKSLSLGFIPLVHGDLVFDETRGWAIVSGDTLATLFATELRAHRVLFGSDVDGLYSKNPKIANDAVLIRRVTRSTAASVIRGLGDEPSKDATGEMRGKAAQAVRIAQNGRECVIFNLKRPNALGEALNGKLATCTRFVPWS